MSGGWSRCGGIGRKVRKCPTGRINHGYTDIVKMLLDRGADRNLQGGEYGSALQAASFRGHTKTVRILLDHSADANVQGERYGSALAGASTACHIDVARLLILKGVDIQQYGARALACARGVKMDRWDFYLKYIRWEPSISQKERDVMLKLLLDAGAVEEVVDSSRRDEGSLRGTDKDIYTSKEHAEDDDQEKIEIDGWNEDGSKESSGDDDDDEVD